MKKGRPTKYEESMCDMVHDYLALHQDKETDKGITVKLPTLEGFAFYIGIHKDTLYEWDKIHPRFSDSLELIRKEQKERLMNNGLANKYNSTIAKLILSSNHGMREKSDVTSNDQTITGNEIIFVDFDEDTTEN